MHFYTLNSQNPSKLYLWEIEDVPIFQEPIQEKLHPNLSGMKAPFYYVFEELRRYPNNQVVFAKAIIPTIIHTTGIQINEVALNNFNFNIYNPNKDLGLIVLWNDNWYRVIGDKPIKTFYVKKQDQFYFEHFSREGKLNEYIKYDYRGN